MYIDHLTSDLFFGNNRVIPEKPGLQNDNACSDCIALWGARRKKSKMANELELAEEMSNSSPEQAMELLSSIGNTLSEFWYHIFILFRRKTVCFSIPVLQNEILFYSFDQWLFQWNATLVTTTKRESKWKSKRSSLLEICCPSMEKQKVILSNLQGR